MTTYLMIGFFGLIGVFSRYGLDRAMAGMTEPFPLSTFSINMAGSLLAGSLYVCAERFGWSPALQTGLLVGLCGGFTTFSAFALQSALMIDKDRALQALIYLVVSCVLGVIAAMMPILMARKLWG